jgi:hypothetical protein
LALVRRVLVLYNTTIFLHDLFDLAGKYVTYKGAAAPAPNNNSKSAEVLVANLSRLLNKKKNKMADLAAKYTALSANLKPAAVPANSAAVSAKSKRVQSRSLRREMDEVVVGRKIATDRRFLAYLSKNSEINSEGRFGGILTDALDFIGERERFWMQHNPASKQMAASAAAAAADGQC